MNYTLLDEFAKSALPGLVAPSMTVGEAPVDRLDAVADMAYRVAEAMVRAKQRRDAAQALADMEARAKAVAAPTVTESSNG